jgi:septation ring formation regulator EzrA
MTSDGTKRISDLIVILERFNQLLELENDALRHYRAGDVQALLEDKAALSRVYENRARGIMQDPSVLAQVDDKLREQLKELTAASNALVAENTHLLKVSIESQKIVLETIKNAVKDARGGPHSYSPVGSSGRVNSRAGSAPVAVDQSL